MTTTSIFANFDRSRNDANANNERVNYIKTDRSLWSKLCCQGISEDQKYPFGLYLSLIWAFFASIALGTTKNENDQYDLLPLCLLGARIAYWAIDEISGEDWKVGFLEGALPQLPLTTLNSVISVCALPPGAFALS